MSLRIIVKCKVNLQGSEMEDHAQPKIGLVLIVATSLIREVATMSSSV